MSKTDALEQELKTASSILEWEMGDIWGHVGVRLPKDEAIAVKLFRPAEEEGVEDWLVSFDFELNKLSGVGTVPMEAAIYSELFRARPDAQAAVHSHAPMCVALSMADKTVYNLHQQSKKFGNGVPTYADPIFIIDPEEGADLARALGGAPAIIIRGHGIVTVGSSIDEACMNALYLERTAKMQAISTLLGYGGPTEDFLEAVQATSRKMMERARSLGRGRAPGDHSAEWRYYANLVHKGERWMRGWT